MPRSTFAVTILFLGAIAIPPARPAGTTNAELERKFTQTVKPFVNKYCVGCHSGETPAAQFDLRSFPNLAW
jgi:hypothetical protein